MFYSSISRGIWVYAHYGSAINTLAFINYYNNRFSSFSVTYSASSLWNFLNQKAIFVKNAGNTFFVAGTLQTGPATNYLTESPRLTAMSNIQMIATIDPTLQDQNNCLGIET